MHEDPDARPAGRLLRVSRPAAQAESRCRRPRAAFPRAQPPVPSRLLLQRAACRAAREPRALVVSERRVPDAAPADRADRVPARARRAWAPARTRGSAERARQQGAAGAARGGVRAERGARRSARAARERRARRENGSAGSQRARQPIEAKRAEHERRLESAGDEWDALVDAALPTASAARCSTALRERMLERNYINNLLAGIEREFGRPDVADRSLMNVARMSKVVGIDLGTTNSLVAYVEDGVPVVIRDESGDGAGAVGRLGVGRWHDLRRPRGAAAAADRRRAHGVFREAVHGQGRRRRRGRGAAVAVPGRPAKPWRASCASGSASASSRRPRSRRSSCAS